MARGSILLLDRIVVHVVTLAHGRGDHPTFDGVAVREAACSILAAGRDDGAGHIVDVAKGPERGVVGPDGRECNEDICVAVARVGREYQPAPIGKLVRSRLPTRWNPKGHAVAAILEWTQVRCRALLRKANGRSS